MPVTQSTMIQTIRERLDESTEGEWLDKEIRRWINLGCKDICRETEVLDADLVIDTEPNVGTYTGPTNMIRCSHAEWNADGNSSIYPLQWRDFNAMDPIWYVNRSITSSHPQFFTIKGYVPTSTFLLYPVPSVVGTLTIKYYRLPADLAVDTNADAATTLDIPEGWDDAVASYAEYMALRKDRDPRWQEAKSLYEETKATLHGLSRFLSDQPGVVVPASNNGGLPGWLVNDSPWGY